jgi:hypothetical protein
MSDTSLRIVNVTPLRLVAGWASNPMPFPEKPREASNEMPLKPLVPVDYPWDPRTPVGQVFSWSPRVDRSVFVSHPGGQRLIQRLVNDPLYLGQAQGRVVLWPGHRPWLDLYHR